MLQALAVPVIGNVCYVFMHGLNRVQVCGSVSGIELIQLYSFCQLPSFPVWSFLRFKRIDLYWLASQVYGAEKLHEVLLHRPENKPLITV